MIKPVVVYPDRSIAFSSTEVRYFDAHLDLLITDMKDTMESLGAEGLAAIQIGVGEAVVVVKSAAGEILELINPKIIRKSGKVRAKERTLYLPGIERAVDRYETIRLIYQDRHGDQHALQAEGDFSLLLQRKIDYTFGGSFMTKMTQQEREGIERELQGKSGGRIVSPEDQVQVPVSGRDYFKSVILKLLVIQFLLLFTPLFNFSDATMGTIYRSGWWISGIVVALIAGFYVYAYREANRLCSCTGCQVVNFLAVSLKFLGIALLLLAANYFLVRPA